MNLSVTPKIQVIRMLHFYSWCFRLIQIAPHPPKKAWELEWFSQGQTSLFCR